jgi:hypothetical protein
MEPTQEQDREAIASRAYAIFEDRQREGIPGDELSDWFAAVKELEGDRPTPAPQAKRTRRQPV